MQFRKLLLLCSAVFASLSSGIANAASVFDFESIAIGTTTPFSDTDAGVTASFTTGSVAADNFFVSPTFFDSLTGNILLDADPPAVPMGIDFSVPLNSITLNFALNDLVGSPTITLEAFAAGISVGSTTTGGTIPLGFVFPEGTISFSSAVFDEVRLTATSPDFAVDNINVTPARIVGIPLPAAATGGIALLAGLVATRLGRGKR